jgi:hypothetical protein
MSFEAHTLRRNPALESDPETINAFIKAMDKYEYLEWIDNIDAEQFQFKSRQLLHFVYIFLLALYEHYSKADEIHTMKKLT